MSDELTADDGGEIATLEPKEVAVRAFRPGIFTDVPFEEYRRISAINASTLAWAEVSAAHLKAALDGKMAREETPALAYGRAFHARILEPHIYWQEYTIAGTCQQLLKSGVRKDLACGADGKFYDPVRQMWYCGVHVPKLKEIGTLLEPVGNLLQPDDARRIEKAAMRIEAHPVVRLIKQRGGFETTVLGVIDDMGLENFPLQFKCRFDKLIAPVIRDGKEVWPATVLDVKTCEVGKATEHEVEKSILKWHYDASAAFYLDGLKRVTGWDARWVWLFIEKSEPFECHILEADAETLTIGRMRYTDWLGKLAVGRLTGEWPGYTHGTQIKRGGLPDWFKRQYLGR